MAHDWAYYQRPLMHCKSSSLLIEHAMEKSASEIAFATTSIHFKTLPIEIMIHVSIATNYHLEKVKSGVLFPKRGGISYLDLLSKELQAYNYFKQKFLITSRHFSTLFSQVEQVAGLLNV